MKIKNNVYGILAVLAAWVGIIPLLFFLHITYLYFVFACLIYLLVCYLLLFLHYKKNRKPLISYLILILIITILYGLFFWYTRTYSTDLLLPV